MAILEPYVPAHLPHLAERILSTVRAGGIVALPTETYYGLGVNPFDEGAVDRLLRIKEREGHKPILVLIGEPGQLSLLTHEISPIATLLVESFWPGALTILFPAHPSLPHNLTAGSQMVGIRLSSCAPLVELLKLVGPLTGTSANRSGEGPALTAQQVAKAIGDAVDLILDAGPAPGGSPSTVIDPREPVRLVREGAVSRQIIQNVLQTHGISLA